MLSLLFNEFLNEGVTVGLYFYEIYPDGHWFKINGC